MNRFARFAASALALSLVPAMLMGCGKKEASTGSDLDYIKQKGTLVVGITDFAPMDYQDADGSWIGFDADLAKAFAESLGVEVQFQTIEWDNKVMELDGKTIDVVWNGMTLTDEVTSSMACSNAYCNNAQVVILPADKAAGYSTTDSLSGLRFAVESGSAGMAQAEEMGLLGENILGSGFDFHMHINKGAGAFVCGEGSALTASIEGKRGFPRVKPPRTVEHGLFNEPTVLNNVETFANVPLIISNGADWYKTIGPENSPGTKAFALTGNIENTGLIEVPMGTTLEEVIYGVGGGMRGGSEFKAVQIGGPSGGCLTTEHLKIPLDFDSLKKVGAMIGSGGLVVMDSKTCMVEVARFFMSFTQNESCGKCVPCREGTRRMLEILERIVAGNGREEDIDLLLELADTISSTALCGLGKTAGNPVVSTIRNFREEYLAHVRDKYCPTHNCSKLRRIYIDPEVCKGCSKCARSCPVNAISGVIRQPFTIDAAKCVKCGACIENCSFGAVKEA